MKKVKKFKKYLRYENALQILREAAEFEIPDGMRKKDKAFKILRIVFDSQRTLLADRERIIDVNFSGSDEDELILVTTEFNGPTVDVQTVYSFSVLTLELVLKRVALLHEADILAQTLGDEEHAIAVDEYEDSE